MPSCRSGVASRQGGLPALRSMTSLDRQAAFADSVERHSCFARAVTFHIPCTRPPNGSCDARTGAPLDDLRPRPPRSSPGASSPPAWTPTHGSATAAAPTSKALPIRTGFPPVPPVPGRRPPRRFGQARRGLQPEGAVFRVDDGEGEATSGEDVERLGLGELRPAPEDRTRLGEKFGEIHRRLTSSPGGEGARPPQTSRADPAQCPRLRPASQPPASATP